MRVFVFLKKPVTFAKNNRPMAKKFNSIQDAAEYLQTLPFSVMINVAAEALYNASNTQTFSKITLTEEQFKEHFRIRGVNELGEPETRGRKRKDK